MSKTHLERAREIVEDHLGESTLISTIAKALGETEHESFTRGHMIGFVNGKREILGCVSCTFDSVCRKHYPDWKVVDDER